VKVAYVSIKRIKGRHYAYLQSSKRIGKKVKTTSKYLGPMNAKGAVSLFSQKTWQALAKMEVLPHHAKPDPTVVMNGLPMSGKNFTADESFKHESGIKSAPVGESADTTSGEAAQPSEGESPSSQGE
jgi:hypothetical protein